MSSTDPGLIERLQSTVGHLGTLTERLGIEFLSAAPQRVTARMPVEGNTQGVGVLHGGASAALAETVASVGAVLHAGKGRGAIGVDLNATHHRALSSGWVTAEATALHLGGRLASYDVVITDDDGRRVCTARLTCMLVDAS